MPSDDKKPAVEWRSEFIIEYRPVAPSSWDSELLAREQDGARLLAEDRWAIRLSGNSPLLPALTRSNGPFKCHALH